MSRLGADGMGGGVGGQAAIGPIAYVPTVVWTNQTLTTQSGFWLKEPGKLTVWISVNVSVAGAAGAITITLPTGYTAVTQTASLSTVVGMWSTASSTNSVLIFAAAGATTQITSAAATLAGGGIGTAGGMFVIPTLT